MIHHSPTGRGSRQDQAARSRFLIEEMACVLTDQVPELGSDQDCWQALRIACFKPGEILNHLDAARDIARAARTSEAALWDRLMRKEDKEYDT